MTGMASALQREGNVAGAKEWLEKALQKNPLSFRIHYQFGTLLAHLDPGAATTEFTKTLELKPDFPFAYRDLGFLEATQNKYAEAEQHFQKAIALGIQDPKVYNQMGICRSQLHELRSAIQSYLAALKLEPDLAEAHLNLALVYQRTGNPQSAVEYKKACRLNAEFCQFAPR